MTNNPDTKSITPSGGSSVSSPEPASFQLKPGDRVGNYVIREQIGEGGFAIVYAAEQEKPVRRKVALKIIKLGMDTKQVIARFEAERQALAMMDHPNVAKVFDAGATETGRPYFVMEYVAGTHITEYCDRQRLTIEERLGLFNQVCDGVQHAHQKGIIHRDIKPSNVLVAVKDGEPQVKVIDFGVAKAITQRLTEKTIYTEQGQLIGTPEYMSPEQAEMTQDDIDTRSDIYSLGVLLYELLTGALPFDPTTLRQAAFGEIQRIIREIEPPKPSTRLGSLDDESTSCADRRQADPKTLRRALRGDLDWITMKALEKDRARRYATASELARDIARHLATDPIDAAPPSRAYKIARLVRKHDKPIGGAVLISLVWVFGPALLSLAMVSIGLGFMGSLLGMLVISLGLPVIVIVLAVFVYGVTRSRLALMNMLVAVLCVVLSLGWGAMIVFSGAEERPSLAWSTLRELRADLKQSHEAAAKVMVAGEIKQQRQRAASAIRLLADFYDADGNPELAAEWRAKLPTEQDAVASDPPADEKQDE